MNAIDLIPVDFLPQFLGLFGIHYLRAVPTGEILAQLWVCPFVFSF